MSRAIEDHLRWLAAKQGLRLVKSRSQNGRDPGYQGWMIVDSMTNAVEAGAHPYAYAMSLEDVAEFLDESEVG